MQHLLFDISINYKDLAFYDNRESLVKLDGYDSLEDYYLRFTPNLPIDRKSFLDEFLFHLDRIKYDDFKANIQLGNITNGLIFTPIVHQIYKRIMSTNVHTDPIDSSMILEISEALVHLLYNDHQNLLDIKYHEFIHSNCLENNSSSIQQFVLFAIESREWYIRFFDEFPIFFDRLILLVNNYSNFIISFFKNLKKDLETIYRTFAYDKSQIILKIKANLGDLHRGAQSTIGLELNDGEMFFYKPRSSKNELEFYKVIEEFENLGLKKSLIGVKSIDMSEYSWHKGVKYQECKAEREVAEFYFNQGINTYVMNLLCVQDLISDNIIAHGKYPSFIDLEICFHPKYKTGRYYKDRSDLSQLYRNGVLQTGLIPQFGFETVDSPGHTNAGLSLYLNERNPSNLPSFDGRIIDISSHMRNFLDGFEYAHEFFKKNQFEIERITSSIENCNCRVLVRYTNIYSRLFKKLFNEETTRSYEFFLYVLEHLYRGFHDIHVPFKIIQSEINQIANGDYPYFSTEIDNVNLEMDRHQFASHYFELSGKSHVAEKVKQISDDNIFKKNLNIVKRAFNIHENKDLPLSNINTQENKADIFANIADYLYALSSDSTYFVYDDYTITKDSKWSQDIQDSDLFQGIPGTGLFLLTYYVYKDSDRKFLEASEKIFAQTEEYFLNSYNEICDNPTTDIGLTHFPCSLLYMYSLYNEISDENRFSLVEDSFDKIWRYIELKLTNDRKLDYLFGSVGLGMLLLKIRKDTSLQRYLSTIDGILIQISNLMIDKSIVTHQDTVTWETQSYSKWGGYAHGSSSTALFFFQMADTFGLHSYREIAIKVLHYDQKLYNSELGYWKKSEDIVGEAEYGWANGVSGIGLSRLQISEFYTNDFFPQELNRINYLLEYSIPKILEIDHSVASGFSGMIEAFHLLNSDESRVSEWISMFESQVNGFDSLKCGGWDKTQIITGLFYGIAGIGYSLMRLKLNLPIPSLLYIKY